MIYTLLPGGLPIALFPDGEDLSASGSGTPSEDDEVEGGDDDDASNGSWEDIEDEEDVWELEGEILVTLQDIMMIKTKRKHWNA